MLWAHDTAGGNAITTSFITPGTSWQRLSLIFTADSTNAIRIHLYYNAGSGTIYYDDVLVQALGAAGSGTTHIFTGKERDDESGLDDSRARFYSSAMGRFLSSDPENAGVILGDPQSWNGYTYARNNPLLYTDPDGLDYQVQCVGECSAESGFNYSVDTYSALQTIVNGTPGAFTMDTVDRFGHHQGNIYENIYGVGTILVGRYSWFLGNYETYHTLQQAGARADAFMSAPERARNALLQWEARHPNITALLQFAAFFGGDGEGPEEFPADFPTESGFEPPLRDVTGKVHQDIPDYVPENWTHEQLEQAKHELQESIKTRNAQQSKYGEEGGHRNQIRLEERLLRQIEKKLGGS